MSITLHRVEAGSYELRRDGAALGPVVLLLAVYGGWRFHVDGRPQDAHYRSHGSARAWLGTEQGRAWLAALPPAEGSA